MNDPDTGDGDAKFVTGNLMRHVIVMSVTSSVGIMAIFAVDLIDLIFISMLGNAALAAAAGYAATILFFTNSINIGLSIAAGALVARSLGEGKVQLARAYATNVAVFAGVTGCVVPLLLTPVLPQVLAILGAEGEAAALAAQYLRIIMPTMAVIGLAMVLIGVLRSYGNASGAMMSTLAGAATNAVFDPIFIFALGLDLQGAAIATVLARIASLLVAAWPVVRTHDALAPVSIASLKRDFTAVSRLAVPAVLTNVATPIGAAIVTREMAKFGTDAVAGMAVVGRLIPVAFAIVLASSGAVGPIIAQNFGAKQTWRGSVRGTWA